METQSRRKEKVYTPIRQYSVCHDNHKKT
jgi:hypothetical protein